MAITATEALCALQNDWVQKQGSDLPLPMGPAKGIWLQVPEHEHRLVPGMIFTQATIINGVCFTAPFKINCWSSGSIQRQAKARTKWPMKDTTATLRGTPSRQTLMYSGSGRARNLYFCFQEIDWELYSFDHPQQVLHSPVSINFSELLCSPSGAFLGAFGRMTGAFLIFSFPLLLVFGAFQGCGGNCFPTLFLRWHKIWGVNIQLLLDNFFNFLDGNERG